MILIFFANLIAFSAPNEHVEWGAQLHSGPSACPPGAPIINVVQRVINDVDSGTGGNYWAHDDFVRQIQVVQSGPTSFCATVSYQGNFTTTKAEVQDSPTLAER